VRRRLAPGARSRRKLDERIAEAQAARVAVEHALACPHDDVVACPNFREVVRRRLNGKPLQEVHGT
jgi:MerR family copper efflux transcriptional regulator